VAERATADLVAELDVLLVPSRIGLLLVDDEDSDHDAASSVERELSV
jgi:hypothetical protein